MGAAGFALRRDEVDSAPGLDRGEAIWEVAVKQGLRRPGFDIPARIVGQGLVDNPFVEIPFTRLHRIAVASLAPIPKDLFDRALIAQATAGGLGC